MPQTNEKIAKILQDDVDRQKAELLFATYQEILEMQQLYNAAIKQIRTKIEILNDEFKVRFSRNPIHHIESRLKSAKSILKKLQDRDFEVSVSSARKNLNDIAGVRIVCSYIDDVYAVAEMLLRQSDIKLIKEQDYIKNPNYNGYRSLHLDIEVPVYLSEHTEYVTAEIQIRSVAMDFWASLEHDLRYKTNKNIPQSICRNMVESAEQIAAIDRKMQILYNEIRLLDDEKD